MKKDIVKEYVSRLILEGSKSPRVKKLPKNPNGLTIGEAIFLANYVRDLMNTTTWKNIKATEKSI